MNPCHRALQQRGQLTLLPSEPSSHEGFLQAVLVYRVVLQHSKVLYVHSHSSYFISLQVVRRLFSAKD